MRSILLLVFTANLVATATAVAIYNYTGIDHFGEDGFITIFSAVQLVAIAWLANRIRKLRGAMRPDVKTPKVWLVIALGFLFLAADEMFKIHENIDYGIHDILGLEETALTDRIDDILVGIYGVIGIVILYVSRTEFADYKKSLPYFIVGFGLLFTMVGIDVITNRNDILPLFFESTQATAINAQLALAEDSLKIFAEGFFVLAFVSIWKRSKSLQQSSGGI